VSILISLSKFLRATGPGVALAALVGLAASLLESWLRPRGVALPAIVLALGLGVLLHTPATQPIYQKGLTFSVKRLLRVAIALMGLRIALSDIAALGAGVVMLTLAVMATTVVSGFLIARLVGLTAGYGALAGAACGVCGASAALATSTVTPESRDKSADLVFVVVAANAVATLQMLVYPTLCLQMGFSDQASGVLLGLAIHDMAQVAGAGYAVSLAVGNVAVIVKLLRVFLLLPVVVGIGQWFARDGGQGAGRAEVQMPWFAVVFVLLAGVNSLAPHTALEDLYRPVRGALLSLSQWGLLLAIAALGLNTSIKGLLASGWRRGAVFLGATAVNLAVALVGILLLMR